jgi:glutamate dehydrogenase/leucine dehydrogenase
MEWIVDEYSKIVGKKVLAIATSKPLNKGGSQGREMATALGGAFVLKRMMEKLRETKKLNVVVQGFGNVGANIAKVLSDWGHRVIAVSDSTVGVMDENGLDIDKMIKEKERSGSFANLNNYKKISNDKMLLLKCDVLIPASISHQIHEKNAKKIKAKIILEMGNESITVGADKILFKRGIRVIPDILANAGGVIVSYFEWYQNMNIEKWSEKEVFEKLENKMKKIFDEVFDKCDRCEMRKAAYSIAVKKILDAERKRGNL